MGKKYDSTSKVNIHKYIVNFLTLFLTFQQKELWEKYDGKIDSFTAVVENEEVKFQGYILFKTVLSEASSLKEII